MAELKRETTRRRELTVDDYFTGVRRRDIAILPRALTLIESNNPKHQELAEELLTRLAPFTGDAVRVGVTGAPGVGKSTFIDSLGTYLTGVGRHVAVLAVDPSSGVTGGSILGDKTRMPTLASQPNAYIRPSPSAAALGGVARKTREGMLVCEAAGYDVVLIETVGVGQSETMVADMTDCFLALMLPGAGDELQGVKRGLLELVDVIAVNKADGETRAAAEMAAKQYASALQSLMGRGHKAPPVLTCSALNHKNIDVVWAAVEKHYARLTASGDLAVRRGRQRARWLWTILDDHLQRAIREHPGVQAIRDEIEQGVFVGTIPPEVAARRIFQAFVGKPP